MTLSTKKVNITYAAYLLICVPLTLLMLLSGIIANSQNEGSIDYDTVLTMNAEYYIKVSNAVFIEDENTIKFTLSSKVVEYAKPKGERPAVITVWLDNSENELEFTAHKLDDTSTDYTCEISDKQKEFKRLIVRVQYKTPDEKLPDTTDAFGATIDGGTKKGEEFIERITIGRKDITKMSAEENKNTVTEKVVLTTTTQVTEKADSSSESDSSEGATTTTKNSTTTDTTTTTTTTTELVTTPENSESASGVTSTAAQSGGGNTTKNTTQATTKGTTKNTATTTAKTTAKTTSKPKNTTTAAQGAMPTGVSMRTNSSTYDINLRVGQTHNVQAVVTPASAEQGVSWSSLRPNVATVDSNGKIKAVGKGTTIITCTTKNGGLKASCMVTVN